MTLNRLFFICIVVFCFFVSSSSAETGSRQGFAPLTQDGDVAQSFSGGGKSHHSSQRTPSGNSGWIVGLEMNPFVFMAAAKSCQDQDSEEQQNVKSKKLSKEGVSNKFPQKMGDFKLESDKSYPGYLLKYLFKEQKINTRVSFSDLSTIESSSPANITKNSSTGSELSSVDQLWVSKIKLFGAENSWASDIPHPNLVAAGCDPSGNFRVAFFNETGGWLNNRFYVMAMGVFDGIIVNIKMELPRNFMKGFNESGALKPEADWTDEERNQEWRKVIFNFLKESARIISG
jgi:predicted DNA binding CopG/RHH family protein